MATGIISLLVLVLTGVFWLVKRRVAKSEDPLQQHRDRYARIDADLAAPRADVLSAGAGADLDELERLRALREKGGCDPR